MLPGMIMGTGVAVAATHPAELELILKAFSSHPTVFMVVIICFTILGLLYVLLKLKPLFSPAIDYIRNIDIKIDGLSDEIKEIRGDQIKSNKQRLIQQGEIDTLKRDMGLVKRFLYKLKGDKNDNAN
jgi:hypothetical protein